MPVLDALPHITIIRGLKGILDFYYWKGLPCVRKWPVIPPSSRSPASLASAKLFGAIVAAYSLLGAVLKELFALDAADQTRTARDLFVSAVLGHLHDHNMSDFLDLLTEATAYLAVLADLTHALETAHTDRLLVRGMDQLLSFQKSLHSLKQALISGAGGYLDSHSPDAGDIWLVTSIGAVDVSNPTTQHPYRLYSDTTSYAVADLTAGWAANVRSYHHQAVVLHPGDVIRVYFYGALAGDTCRIDLIGHVMTLET